MFPESYAPFCSMAGRQSFLTVDPQQAAAPGPAHYTPDLEDHVKGGDSLKSKVCLCVHPRQHEAINIMQSYYVCTIMTYTLRNVVNSALLVSMCNWLSATPSIRLMELELVVTGLHKYAIVYLTISYIFTPLITHFIIHMYPSMHYYPTQ